MRIRKGKSTKEGDQDRHGGRKTGGRGSPTIQRQWKQGDEKARDIGRRECDSALQRHNKRRTGGRGNKDDDGGEGGKKERRRLRRRPDKTETRNGVHGGRGKRGIRQRHDRERDGRGVCTTSEDKDGS